MPTRRRPGFAEVIVLALLAGLSPGLAHAGEAHYVLMFGSQRTPNQPNYAHTYATFVRVRWAGNGPCRAPAQIEAHTISWLPANLKIRTRALLPECGRNFDLDETMRFVLEGKQRVSMWGPYEIDPDLYCRAQKQIARLNIGRLQYKANDIGFPASRVSNCIHAVSETISRPLLIVGTPGWGEVASFMVLVRMRPWILDTDTRHTWVSSALGLDRYPIIYRERIAPPASGTFLGPVFRLFGGEIDVVPTYGPPR